MSVTVELQNLCPGHWVPSGKVMKAWLARAARDMPGDKRPLQVSIRVVNEQDSADLNRQYRGKDMPTNVLSFACQLPDPMLAPLKTVPVGDIALCAPVIEQEATAQCKTLESHWAHLLTHGFLHLQGYDHQTETEAKQMEQLEIAILSDLGYANPY